MIKKVYEVRENFMGKRVELADNEQVVIKVPLNEEEVRFMKENEYATFYDFQ